MKRGKISVESANAPDLDAAASAILPLFLAFMEGRLERRQRVGIHIVPTRADETRSTLPAVVEGSL